MKPPITFYNKENFIISIEYLSQDQIKGVLKIINTEVSSEHKFEGLVYQINKLHYHFTFFINWQDYDIPSYTTFVGHVIFEENNINNVLELNWLFVQEGIEIDNSTNGCSKLTSRPTFGSHLDGRLPFPQVNKKVLYKL